MKVNNNNFRLRLDQFQSVYVFPAVFHDDRSVVFEFVQEQRCQKQRCRISSTFDPYHEVLLEFTFDL